MVVEGITRAHSIPAKQAVPTVPAVLRLMLGACSPASAALDVRNRAMLLLGFGAALRRSELVALRVGDVEPVPRRGLQAARAPLQNRPARQGKGQALPVWTNPAEPLLCPATALDAWLAHRRAAPDLDWSTPEDPGPFSSDYTVPRASS